MNEDTVQTFITALRQIRTRDDLKELLFEIKKSSLETNDEFQSRINEILCLPASPVAGVDRELITAECQMLISDLENKKIRLIKKISDDARIAEQILKDFSEVCFLERFWRPTHAKCRYGDQDFKQLRPQNEYEVQHILFCVLRPYFLDCRCEVSSDDGNLSVRADIWLSKEITIEVKSTTRPSYTQAKLAEEISADMIRFQDSCTNLYFFIYDPKKLIKDREQFISNYEKKGRSTGNRIRIYVYQTNISSA